MAVRRNNSLSLASDKHENPSATAKASLRLNLSASHVKPSRTFPGSSISPLSHYAGNYYSTPHHNVYAAATQGAQYSRYGVKSRSSVDQSQQHSRKQYNFQPLQRRHTVGTPTGAIVSHTAPQHPSTGTKWPTSSPEAEPVSPFRRGSHEEHLRMSWSDSLGALWPNPAKTLKQYSDLLQDPDRGIPMQERLVNGERTKVFSGSDAIEWFVDNMVGITSVEKAQLAGTQLLKCKLIKHVLHSENDKFLGSPNALYQFVDVVVTEQSDTRPVKNDDKIEETKERSKCILQ